MAPSLPRLLAGIPPHGAMSLDAHLAVHGPLPRLPRQRRGTESPLIGRVERAGLRGRGGAGLFALFLLVWLPGGPLGSEWPRRSGTPSSLLSHSHSSASVEASHR